MALLLLLVCFFGWGFAVYLMTHVAKDDLGIAAILFYNLFGYAAANLFVISNVKFGWSWSHFLTVLIGVLFVIANFAYYKLSEMGGQASVLAPLTALYVVVPVLLGALILKEPLSARKLAGIALAVVAIILLSSEDKALTDAGVPTEAVQPSSE